MAAVPSRPPGGESWPGAFRTGQGGAERPPNLADQHRDEPGAPNRATPTDARGAPECRRCASVTIPIDSSPVARNSGSPSRPAVCALSVETEREKLNPSTLANGNDATVRNAREQTSELRASQVCRRVCDHQNWWLRGVLR